MRRRLDLRHRNHFLEELWVLQLEPVVESLGRNLLLHRQEVSSAERQTPLNLPQGLEDLAQRLHLNQSRHLCSVERNQLQHKRLLVLYLAARLHNRQLHNRHLGVVYSPQSLLNLLNLLQPVYHLVLQQLQRRSQVLHNPLQQEIRLVDSVDSVEPLRPHSLQHQEDFLPALVRRPSQQQLAGFLDQVKHRKHQQLRLPSACFQMQPRVRCRQALRRRHLLRRH
jgi:hypothetical protein